MDENLIKYIEKRRDYFAAKDLHSGWSGNESGACCQYCILDEGDLSIRERAGALKKLVGCKDPFQIKCSCHLGTREAVRNGIVEAHNQLIRYFTEN